LKDIKLLILEDYVLLKKNDLQSGVNPKLKFYNQKEKLQKVWG